MNHCPKLKTIIWKIYARQEAACAFSCPADVPTTMRSRISACPTQKVAYVPVYTCETVLAPF